MTEFQIPDIEDHDDVRAALSRYAALSAQLADTAAERQELERVIGPDAKLTERQLRARAVLRGGDATAMLDAIDRLGAIRETEAVLSDAVGLAKDELDASRQRAKREYTPTARHGVFAEQAKVVVAAYLLLLKENMKLNRLVAAISNAGMGNGLSQVFSDTAAVVRSNSRTAAALREFIAAGHTDADAVRAALPGILENGF